MDRAAVGGDAAPATPGQIDGSPARLTARECQVVLRGAVRGCDNDEIALPPGYFAGNGAQPTAGGETKLNARNRTHAAVNRRCGSSWCAGISWN